MCLSRNKRQIPDPHPSIPPTPTTRSSYQVRVLRGENQGVTFYIRPSPKLKNHCGTGNRKECGSCSALRQLAASVGRMKSRKVINHCVFEEDCSGGGHRMDLRGKLASGDLLRGVGSEPGAR